MYVLANHYAFPALTLWYFTVERPRMQRAETRLVADVLAMYYLMRLRNKALFGSYDAWSYEKSPCCQTYSASGCCHWPRRL